MPTARLAHGGTGQRWGAPGSSRADAIPPDRHPSILSGRRLHHRHDSRLDGLRQGPGRSRESSVPGRRPLLASRPTTRPGEPKRKGRSGVRPRTALILSVATRWGSASGSSPGLVVYPMIRLAHGGRKRFSGGEMKRLQMWTLGVGFEEQDGQLAVNCPMRVAMELKPCGPARPKARNGPIPRPTRAQSEIRLTRPGLSPSTDNAWSKGLVRFVASLHLAFTGLPRLREMPRKLRR